MQQANRIVVRVIGAETVGTDQFRQTVGVMRVCSLDRAHFMQNDRHPGPGQLPSRLRPGETAADDVNRLCHARAMLRRAWRRNPLHKAPGNKAEKLAFRLVFL